MSELFAVSARAAVITGGTRGLGRAVAEALLRAGVVVHITGRDKVRVEQAVAELREIGTAHGHVVRLDDRDSMLEFTEEIAEGNADLGILVNNAGRAWNAPLDEYALGEFDRVLNVDLVAPFAIIARLVPLLERAAAAQGTPARIVNIGSADGVAVSGSDNYAYGAAKAALHHLTRHLAARLASRNITVNSVAPGIFRTDLTRHLTEDAEIYADVVEQIPMGRLGTPSDIAAAVLYLVSSGGSYITGTTLSVDGGGTAARAWFTPPRSQQPARSATGSLGGPESSSQRIERNRDEQP